MRQRKAKDLENRLQACEHLMIRDAVPGMWKEYFGRQADTYVEIGCGKGDFIIKKALDDPASDFVAIEGQETVVLRAMEKVLELEESGQSIPNLRFVADFVEDARHFFAPGSLSGIYLNFSDPWPKARHAKRRLTHRDRLANYAQVVRPGGFLEFKTDNEDLYDFTLEEIATGGYPILEQTRDLHSTEYESRRTMTEYEKKFSTMGKNINYVKIKLR
jgi:tRNA (guanine-N7-)-methyltransferase